MQAGLGLCWSHIPHRWKSQVTAHIVLVLLEAGIRVSDVAHGLGYNEHTIYCLQASFQQIGSEKDRPNSGRLDNNAM